MILEMVQKILPSPKKESGQSIYDQNQGSRREMERERERKRERKRKREMERESERRDKFTFPSTKMGFIQCQCEACLKLFQFHAICLVTKGMQSHATRQINRAS